MASLRMHLLLAAVLSHTCAGAVITKQGLRATPQLSLTHMLTNSTVFQGLSHEIEYELRRDNVPTVNKVVFVLLAMLVGGCGLDRCFMGQWCCGILKCMTGGGFGIWALVDYVIAALSAYNMHDAIDTAGYHAKFEKESVEAAYYVALVILALQWGPTLLSCFFYTCLGCCAASAGLVGVGGAAAAAAYQDSMATKAKSGRDLTVTSMPKTLTMTLRTSGLLPAVPSEGEVKSLFNSIDKDHDGKLDVDELTEALAKIGVSEGDVKRMIAAADKNNDGKLSLEEFMGSCAPIKQP